MSFEAGESYRKDIDGLRAIAVLAVIFFHFGWMPNGFLGVDIFFVISGYLITGLIYSQIVKNQFSMKDFYLRRTRRILPLAVFIGAVSLIVGMAFMLPDDLENLAQSVIATNFFGNNLLHVLTTQDYWDVVNEYKPLMHTWSLGVEEQFYVCYPLLFWFVAIKKPKWLLPVLVILTLGSVYLLFSPFKEYEKFYLLPFRFFELSVGGIAAIALKDRLVKHRWSACLVAALLFLLFLDVSFIRNEILCITTVVLTVAILVTFNDQGVVGFLLKNRVMVAIGLISFSLYMWHQVLLAYAKYILFSYLHTSQLVVIFLLTVALSVGSYFMIEQPFRDRRKVATPTLLLSLGVLYLVINSCAFFIHMRGGVLRDVPELGIAVSKASRKMHAKYNHRIHSLNKNFRSTDKVRVLVVGNSFARDWANVLLESRFRDSLEICYVENLKTITRQHESVQQADVIFCSTDMPQRLEGIASEKLYVVGIKNFGMNNGIHYNHCGTDYYQQRTSMENGFLEINSRLKQVWGRRYIDLIGKVIDQDETVPVFTPNFQFISQDCRHLTKSGAQYFAQLLENRIGSILVTCGRTRNAQNLSPESSYR